VKGLWSGAAQLGALFAGLLATNLALGLAALSAANAYLWVLCVSSV
jgi:hypothetical protein